MNQNARWNSEIYCNIVCSINQVHNVVFVRGKCVRVVGSQHVFDFLRQDLSLSTIVSSSRANSSFFFKFRSCVLWHRSYGWQPLLDTEASGSSETTVNTLYSTQCRNTQDRSLNLHLCRCFQSCSFDFRSVSPSLYQPVWKCIVKGKVAVYLCTYSLLTLAYVIRGWKLCWLVCTWHEIYF